MKELQKPTTLLSGRYFCRVVILAVMLVCGGLAKAEELNLAGFAGTQLNSCAWFYYGGHDINYQDVSSGGFVFSIGIPRVYYFDACSGFFEEIPRDTMNEDFDSELTTRKLGSHIIFSVFYTIPFADWAHETTIEITLVGALDTNNDVVNNGDIFVELFFNDQPMNINVVSDYALWF